MLPVLQLLSLNPAKRLLRLRRRKHTQMWSSQDHFSKGLSRTIGSLLHMDMSTSTWLGQISRGDSWFRGGAFCCTT